MPGPHDKFHTQAQIEYAKTIALNHLTGELNRTLKALEFDHKPAGPFGIGVSLKVEGLRSRPIHHYREKKLETDVISDQCTLVYAIYGAFAFCPDCGSHNSFTILSKNLEIAEKLLTLAAGQERDLAEHLVGDALENVVSAFDGFGREICRVVAARASNPTEAEDVRFQSLTGARARLQKLFGFDLAAFVSAHDWDFACRCFQKRHLLAHKMGVVDDDYLKLAKDPTAVAGRKIPIAPDEVKWLVGVVRDIGGKLRAQLLGNLPPVSSVKSGT